MVKVNTKPNYDILDDNLLKNIPEPSVLGLPFTSWRQEQLHAIVGVLTANTRYVILEAPTGIGKSGIGIALHGFSGGRRTAILTGTKQLQDQYAGLGARTVKGRANYDCLLDEEVTAADGVCTVGGLCPHQRNEEDAGLPPSCPYYSDKFLALRSPVCAHSYSYFLNEANYAGGFSDPDQILVCDEGHDIDNQIRNFVEINYHWQINQKSVQDTESHGDWREYAIKQIPIVGEEQIKVRRNMRTNNTPQVAKKLRSINSHISALGQLLDLDDSWVITEKEGFRGMTTYSFKPAWINNYTESLLFRHGFKVVIMSATILDPELICQMLGIPEDQVTTIRLDSPFNPIQRPLIYRPVIKVSGQYDPKPLVEAIDGIVEEHGTEKGIVHTANYKLAKNIMEGTSKQSLFTHSSIDRAGQLSRFKDTVGSQNVLVSPSMGTGVDLPYDQLRYQIIAKIPFPDRGDEQIKKRLSVGIHGEDDSSLGNRWYNWQTACSIVQTYGRAMRSENDYGVTYLLDKNWDWWYRQNKNLIPGWVQEAILT